jgi:hypothetical protein
MIPPVAIERPKQSIALVNNLDHQCIRTSTSIPISCIISEGGSRSISNSSTYQLLCDNIATNVVSKSATFLVLVLAFLGGP